MAIISFFSILSYFLLANLSTVIISGKQFGKCLPLTLMSSAFLLFFSQIILKTFTVGFYIGIGYSLLSFGYLFYRRKDKTILKRIKGNYITPSFYSFIIIIILITILDFNRTYSHWDEFSHWGEMLKEMIRIDKFYSATTSVLQAHKDYPPILQLFELYVIKLGGIYKESVAIFSLHILELSLLISVLPEKINFKKKNIIFNSFFIFFLFFLTTIFFDSHEIVNSIYNDYLMALLVSYSLSIIFFNKNKKSLFTIVSLSVISSFLLLTKQIGITLYLMVLFFYFVSLFLEKDKNDIKFFAKVFIILVLIPLILFSYWNSYIKTLGIKGQFNASNIEISQIYSIYRGYRGREDQKIAATGFVKAIRDYSLTTSYIPLSYIQAVILGLFLLFIIYNKNKDLIDKKNMYLLICTMLIGAIGYAFVMWCTYIFCFKETEAINLASFDRYMVTYVLIIIYFAIMFLLYCCYKKNNLSIIIYLTIILFLLTTPKKLTYLTPFIFKEKPTFYETNALILKEQVEDNNKVFIIAEDTQGEYQYFVKYYANPIITNMTEYNWPTDEDTNYEKYYNSIKDKIKDYDYLYIATINDKFNEKYHFVFPSDVKEHQLYKIENNNKEYKLILINGDEKNEK